MHYLHKSAFGQKKTGTEKGSPLSHSKHHCWSSVPYPCKMYWFNLSDAMSKRYCRGTLMTFNSQTDDHVTDAAASVNVKVLKCVMLMLVVVEAPYVQKMSLDLDGYRRAVSIKWLPSGLGGTLSKWNEWKCIDFKCVRKPTKSRLSLTHHANKSSRWAY